MTSKRQILRFAKEVNALPYLIAIARVIALIIWGWTTDAAVTEISERTGIPPKFLYAALPGKFKQ